MRVDKKELLFWKDLTGTIGEWKSGNDNDGLVICMVIDLLQYCTFVVVFLLINRESTSLKLCALRIRMKETIRKWF